MNIEKQLFIVLKNGTTEKQIFILKRKIMREMSKKICNVLTFFINFLVEKVNFFMKEQEIQPE